MFFVVSHFFELYFSVGFFRLICETVFAAGVTFLLAWPLSCVWYRRNAWRSAAFSAMAGALLVFAVRLYGRVAGFLPY